MKQILLVPTTEVLLTHRDRDTGSLLTELATTDEFLGSHVLKVPAQPGLGGGGEGGTPREMRSKAKQFTTLNGRTIVIKESSVYSNKGFKNLSQAQLLSDAIYHEDSLDVQQWLIYYISRPLVGSLEPIQVTIAELPGMLKNGPASPASPATPSEASFSGSSTIRKDIKTFDDLLNHFPMISRQMNAGLDKVFKDFHRDIGKPLPDPGSATPSASRSRSSSMSSVRSDANSSMHSVSARRRAKRASTVSSMTYADDEEEHMRRVLESAITAAIDLFQQVDKQQLSFLASSTDLTGPAVEKLIERYVAEHVNDTTLFPRLCRCHQGGDQALEAQVRRMGHIDVAQVGLDIDGGREGKRRLTARLNGAIEAFRRLGVASGPQQMLDILLETQKIITGNRGSAEVDKSQNGELQSEKAPATTMNADSLVSLLLLVVIRSGVRHLQARLAYMRNFIFLDDVDGGEMGYALSTFEAVLQYLTSDSGGLREASKRNRRLWQAARNGNVSEIRAILDPENGSVSDEEDSIIEGVVDDGNRVQVNGTAHPFDVGSYGSHHLYENTSEDANLSHVFPFQANGTALPPLQRPKITKRVSLDLQSLSGTSEFSFHSRTSTLNSANSAIEGDTSIEKLCQTEDPSGNSVMMMAIEARKPEALDYLLSLDEYYTANAVVEDCDGDGMTLLSAAVQLAHMELIDIMVDFVFSLPELSAIKRYLAKADSMGRTVGHYLFQAPHLIHRFGTLLPWRQRDRNGQTPLLALCRSYDHPKYLDMVNAALQTAVDEQGDGQPLHVDLHVDGKGNTLLHAVKDPYLAARLLQHSDAAPNAPNDKRFTPLMVASKFGRLDLVRALLRDARVDPEAREYRGMTAVELAKDDELRRRIDDMMLVSNHAANGDGRVTSVVRAFVVEDGQVRLLIKSAARSRSGDMISVSMSQRSVADFEHLAKSLAVEQPASWLPSIFNFRSPCQIPSRPSKAVLSDVQSTLDRFLKVMLAHAAFGSHELLWEFVLVPEIPPEVMAERSRKKGEMLQEKIREEYEPIEDVRDVELFVTHARESIRPVNHATRSVLRRVAGFRNASSGLSLPRHHQPTH